MYKIILSFRIINNCAHKFDESYTTSYIITITKSYAHIKAFGVGAFITSAVALGLLQGLPRFTDVTSRATISREIPGSNPETLFLNSYLGGGIGITAATLTIIYEIIFIVLRFLNIGLINLKIKIFLIIVRT